ncbi:hypothetical protein ACIGO8_33245 [Streptomyces sp. NPDC053493]|uniref:hypothetical protein n=1 Tax=Streptomyces sp. NPDC053493 TaxID=3365705 RepID=UPI0037D925A6
MSEVSARLEALRETDSIISLESLGGFETILSEREELLGSSDMPLVISVLLDEWPTLPSPDQAASLITEAIAAQDAFALEDIVDDTLSCAEALPALAAPLSRALGHRAQGEDAEAGIALEGLTRLALGGWTRALRLRGQLVEQAGELAEAAASAPPDPVMIQRLVRCLGAAAERWEDEEIPDALEALLVFEDYEDDICFELGMTHLRAGLTQEAVENVLPELRSARDWLSRCSRYEDRLDALIFQTALDALLAFTAGQAVSDALIHQLHSLVLAYRLNSLNEQPTWRQPRADATVTWVQLADRLHALQDLDSAWWDPPALISSMAQVYSAHRTLHLLAAPDIPYKDDVPPPTQTAALPHLLQPRLASTLAARGDSAAFLDRWLAVNADNPETTEEARSAIVELQQALRSGGDAELPKGGLIDVRDATSALALPTDVGERLTAMLQRHPGLAHDLNNAGRIALNARNPDRSDYFNTIYRNLRSEIERISGVSGEPALRVEEVLLFLMRYTRWAIDTETGGATGEPFLRPFKKDEAAPEEVDMAKDLAKRGYTALSTTPLWEVKNIGSGRTDVVLFFGAFRLVIECKRELDHASIDYLASRYSYQPAEYGATDINVGFLVVLELTPKTRHAQLHQCLKVTAVPPAEPGGRPHAVLTARIQGNTRSPSYSSTPAAHRARTSAARLTGP